MNAIKNAFLNVIACIPVSWIMAFLVLGMVTVLAVVVIAGLNFFTS